VTDAYWLSSTTSGENRICGRFSHDPAVGPDDWRAETARLEIDARVLRLITLSAARFVAADTLGRLHWLEVVD
jgi:hypothetical protein